jgi:lysozyme
MKDYCLAIELICKYEGFNEKAYPDPATGGAPFTFGFGSQYYPDGSPVSKGHCCTKHKALEYLTHELNIIDDLLEKENIKLDYYMKQSLLSFIHSVGWEPFRYSQLLDDIENEDWSAAVDCMMKWIYDHEGQATGGLLSRRKEEVKLFLYDINPIQYCSSNILLKAFRCYSGTPNQINAIQELEETINPYVLTDFSNSFELSNVVWLDELLGEEGSLENFSTYTD